MASAARPFESLDDLNTYTTELMNDRNRGALADFCGLSPEQMSCLLYEPFTSPKIIRYSTEIEPGPDVEIMGIFFELVQAIGESGLKATATGNLPLKFCKSMAQQMQHRAKDRRSLRIGGIRSETDLEQLHCTRLLAELAGLIRKYRGHFVLTRKCKDMLSQRGHGAVYFELFKSYTTQFNWAYQDGYPEAEIVQQSFLYTLFLMARFGGCQRPQQFYEEKFLSAFPMAINMFAETDYSTAADSARRCYALRALDRFAAFFGLSELVLESQELYDYRYVVRKTALLDVFVTYSLSAPP